jgi:MerR family transcriptional regulator, light-induced transcriptional regulator
MDANLRIGELSRRSGVTPELLRAWERRYGLLRPQRSAGGLRLYSAADLERVRQMREHIAHGLAAREAAALAARGDVEVAVPGDAAVAAAGNAGATTAAFDARAARDALTAAMDAYDEPAAQAQVDGLLAVATVDALLTEIVIPYLHELGERWERGEVSVAQEHFASNVLRGRLLGLARGWGRGAGPWALLACPEGERHDLGLIAFGLALRERGWRIAYLGPDTPLASIAETADLIRPTVVVLSAVTPEPLRDLEPLAGQTVALAGVGARGIDAEVSLTGDPVAEAERVTRLLA